MFVSKVVHYDNGEPKPECVLVKLASRDFQLPAGRVIKLKCAKHPDGHSIDKWGAIPDSRIPYMLP